MLWSDTLWKPSEVFGKIVNLNKILQQVKVGVWNCHRHSACNFKVISSESAVDLEEAKSCMFWKAVCSEKLYVQINSSTPWYSPHNSIAMIHLRVLSPWVELLVRAREVVQPLHVLDVILYIYISYDKTGMSNFLFIFEVLVPSGWCLRSWDEDPPPRRTMQRANGRRRRLYRKLQTQFEVALLFKVMIIFCFGPPAYHTVAMGPAELSFWGSCPGCVYRFKFRIPISILLYEDEHTLKQNNCVLLRCDLWILICDVN